MDRRGRAGQVVDLVDLDVEREGHVVAHQLEARVVQADGDVLLAAGEEIVDAQHVVAGASSRSHRCEPRKPAPPVTNIRLLMMLPKSDPRSGTDTRPANP